MKPWYKSRTLIVNAAVAALAAFELVSGLLQPFLSVNVFTAVAVGLPVGCRLLGHAQAQRPSRRWRL